MSEIGEINEKSPTI